MSFSYLFDPNKQFQDRNGVNNVGGFLRVYIDGTDDRATTYKDFNGTLNEADIMLDTDGRAVVIVDDNLTFRIEVYERDGALQWTVTQFTARGEGGGGGSSTPVVVDGTANEIDVTESMTAGVKYYTIGLATVVKNTLLGLLASLSNLVGILNSKADKVQGSTAGNLAALDASGNLTDSGSKSADFKTKQTPVSDPSADGAGLSFIDSISQDANGEITPHKKAVQDGTTAQKGVVKLNNAIDSTSVTEAATPKAVKDAYDELNNKIVARATFLSQAEWAVQSQLPGDPAKVYYVENGTGEDAYTVYVWKESTSTYEEVDESSIDLDGYWHDSPTTTGSGNVVTNITLGNDGVPQVEKGLTALTHHQSVTDNDPTLAWSTRSKVGTIGGTDLHVTMPSLDTAMSDSSDNAVKNKVVDAALKAISRLWRESIGETAVDLDNLYFNDGQLKLYEWVYANRNNVSNKPVTGGGELVVLSYANYSVMQLCMDGSDGTKCYVRQKNFSGWTDWLDIRSASWINIGTFGTDRIADDAITAAKVKDNETLPVNISGKSSKSDSLDTKYPSSTNFDDFVPAINEVVQYSINGNYTNGPSGAASGGYWGVLQLFWRNRCPYQLFFNSTNMWVRYTTTQTGDSWTNWDPWTLVNSAASSITSGTFDAARIPTSLPNTGVGYLLPLVHFSASNITLSTQYALIARKTYSGNDARPGEIFRLFYNDVFIDFKTYGLIKPSSQTASLSVAPLQSFGMGEASWSDRLYVTWTNDPSAQTIDVNIYFKFSVGENKFVTLYQYNGQAGGDRYNYTWTPYQGIESQYGAAALGTEATYEWDRAYLYGSALYASKIGSYDSHPSIGSTTTPVYVDSDGQVKPCDPSLMSVLNASKASAANKLKDEYGSSFSVGYDAVPVNFLDGVPRACANKYAYTKIYKGSASTKFDFPLQTAFGVPGGFNLWIQPGDSNTFRWRIYTQITGGTQYNTNYWNASITGILRVRGHVGASGVDQSIDDITEIAATVPVPEGTPRWVDLYAYSLNTQVKQILMGEMLLNVSQGGTGSSGASSPFMLRIKFTMVSDIGSTTSTVNAIIEAYSYN